jgi:hypothetical protein
MHRGPGLELRRGAGLRSAAQVAEAGDTRPGRACPTAYRYSPRVFDRPPEILADTLYVVGGLYGNIEALAALQDLLAREPGSVKVVFNGDFHWFDVSAGDFEAVTREVARHHSLRGNVETELSSDDASAGCGCAYPLDVSDAEVGRSNDILELLRRTSKGFPQERRRLAALPMHLTARVGDARIGIVHGDAASLAGWGFAQDRLDDAGHARWVASAFREARVDVFASTHTCLPALRSFDLGAGEGVVVNNGAAGMPNFADDRSGLITRIATRPLSAGESLYGVNSAGVSIEAIALRYDHDRWLRRFVGSWPAGSAAHASYFRRITEGTRFSREKAAPRRIAA